MNRTVRMNMNKETLARHIRSIHKFYYLSSVHHILLQISSIMMSPVSSSGGSTPRYSFHQSPSLQQLPQPQGPRATTPKSCLLGPQLQEIKTEIPSSPYTPNTTSYYPPSTPSPRTPQTPGMSIFYWAYLYNILNIFFKNISINDILKFYRHPILPSKL